MTRTILLDLDGTLIDPVVGIVGCYRHALERIGFAHDPSDDLRWVIGPPLRRSFAQILGGRHDVEQAVALYRERYAASGIFEAEVYPGILEAVAALHDAGYRMMLCTAKARVFAERIVAHFGFAPYLSGVYGAELDGRFDDKGELIAHIIAERELDPARTAMVGDRDNDMLAAKRNGVAGIGILWGYGDAAELTAAGADLLVEMPAGLAAVCAAVLERGV